MFSDGSEYGVGTKEYSQSYTFEPNKKITKIECIMEKSEWDLLRITFYSGKETLVKVGSANDDMVNFYGGRVEEFNIADDEKLIGCKLDYSEHHFLGVTWIKMKVRFSSTKSKKEICLLFWFT